MVESTTGEVFSADKVILTAPLPQSLELLEENQLLQNKDHDLKSVSYSKALILLATFQEEVSLPELESSEERCFLMKERELHSHGLVYDPGASWAHENFERTEVELLPLLQQKLASGFRSPVAWGSSEVKKWRYSRVINPLSEAFRDLGQGLMLAGDAFAQGGILGALISAKKLAKALLT